MAKGLPCESAGAIPALILRWLGDFSPGTPRQSARNPSLAH